MPNINSHRTIVSNPFGKFLMKMTREKVRENEMVLSSDRTNEDATGIKPINIDQ